MSIVEILAIIVLSYIGGIVSTLIFAYKLSEKQKENKKEGSEDV